MDALLQESALSAGSAVVPVPLREITSVLPVEELLETVSCPVACPVATGTNCTVNATV